VPPCNEDDDDDDDDDIGDEVMPGMVENKGALFTYASPTVGITTCPSEATSACMRNGMCERRVSV
jgi:hypothetical protein